MAHKKSLSEKQTLELESRIPELASQATLFAYWKAKSNARTVVVAKGGYIVAEYADGSEKKLSPTKPRRKVKAGVPMSIGPGSSMNAHS